LSSWQKFYFNESVCGEQQNSNSRGAAALADRSRDGRTAAIASGIIPGIRRRYGVGKGCGGGGCPQRAGIEKDGSAHVEKNEGDRSGWPMTARAEDKL